MDLITRHNYRCILYLSKMELYELTKIIVSSATPYVALYLSFLILNPIMQIYINPRTSKTVSTTVCITNYIVIIILCWELYQKLNVLIINSEIRGMEWPEMIDNVTQTLGEIFLLGYYISFLFDDKLCVNTPFLYLLTSLVALYTSFKRNFVAL